MLEFVKFIWTRRVILYIVLMMLLCPLLTVLGALTPENLSFLEPVVCPPGMHLDQVTETQTDLRGTVIALDAVCTDGQQKVNATSRLVLFMCGAPILVGVLLVLPAFFTPSKKQNGPAGSEK